MKKSSKAPDLGTITEEIIAWFGRDCELLERFAGEPSRRGLGRYNSGQANPVETMVESLLTKTGFPSRSPPHYSPKELRERSFARLARAGFDTSAKRKRLARALVSAGLIRRMTLAWLGATKRGAVATNLGKMFGKNEQGNRIVGLPAYDAELARQIYDSPAFLRRYLQSDERAFMVLMGEGGTHPVLLNMPSFAILLVSLYASNAVESPQSLAMRGHRVMGMAG